MNLKNKLIIKTMKINLSNFISWQTCIILLLLLIFFLWLAYGGEENLEYVGLSPLQSGVDASEYIGNKSGKRREEESKSNNIESEEETSNEQMSNEFSEFGQNEEGEYEEMSNEENDDETSNEMSIEFENKKYSETNFVNSYETKKVLKFSTFPTSNPQLEMSKSPKIIKSPRSLALGDHVCRKNGKLSKGEMICKQVMEEIYGVPFYCVRPNFLKNPETGRNLELDMYNDSLKIAVEYNSSQHYVFPNTFHKTYEEFINQVRRDQFKVETCDKNGVYLITVPHNIPVNYNSIKEYIQKHLPENYLKNV